MSFAIQSRRIRLGLWGLLLVGFAIGILLSVVVWHRGEMTDHGILRTIGWASAGLALLAFQYPRKRM